VKKTIKQSLTNPFRQRMHQIKKSREKFLKNNPDDVVIDSRSFMVLVNQYMGVHKNFSEIYLWSDNPLCGFLGLYNVDSYKTFYCAVEDFTDGEIIKINNCKKILGESR